MAYDYSEKQAVSVAQGIPGTIGGLQQAKLPHVQQELAGLDARIQDLESAINQLEQRLSPILRSVPPSPATEAGKKDGRNLVAVASALANVNESLAQKIAWLKFITERVEV